MQVRMEIDFENLNTEIKYIDNCEGALEEGAIVNLSPELPIPQGLQNKDHIFPWMHFVEDHFNLESKPSTHKFGNKQAQDIHMALGGNFAINEAWLLLKKAWSLHLNQKPDLAVTFLEKYKKITGYKDDLEFNQVLFHFSLSLISPGKWQLFENVAEKISTINTNNREGFFKIQIILYKRIIQ